LGALSSFDGVVSDLADRRRHPGAPYLTLGTVAVIWGSAILSCGSPPSFDGAASYPADGRLHLSAPFLILRIAAVIQGRRI
jgi:hypothetical protein